MRPFFFAVGLLKVNAVGNAPLRAVQMLQDKMAHNSPMWKKSFASDGAVFCLKHLSQRERNFYKSKGDHLRFFLTKFLTVGGFSDEPRPELSGCGELKR